MFEEQYTRRYHDKVVVMNVNYSDIPVRGNLVVTEDDERDRQLEDSVIARLDDGDIWAWADVEIYVEIDGVKSESEYIGGCSYVDAEDFIKCGYYEDMVARCINSIKERNVMKRGRPLKGDERLDARLGFRIPKTLHQTLLKACEDRGITKSDFITESLQRNLENAI